MQFCITKGSSKEKAHDEKQLKYTETRKEADTRGGQQQQLQQKQRLSSARRQLRLFALLFMTKKCQLILFRALLQWKSA